MSNLKDPLNLGKKTVKTLEVSRVSNDFVGICPACGQPMQTAVAAGIDSYVCVRDRVCLPMPNKE